jgi:peptide/nickel transport system substrate-binding protein
VDALINATHTSSSLSAFYAYANYTAEQEPSLWLPSPVDIEAVSKHLHHVSQSPLDMFLPEYWTCSTKSC